MNDSIKFIEVVSIFVTTFATGVIAIYAAKAHNLSIQIKILNEKNNEREEKFKNQLKELYKAIVISNFPCSGASTTEKLRDFKEHFKDRDKYFDGIFDQI